MLRYISILFYFYQFYFMHSLALWSLEDCSKTPDLSTEYLKYCLHCVQCCIYLEMRRKFSDPCFGNVSMHAEIFIYYDNLLIGFGMNFLPSSKINIFFSLVFPQLSPRKLISSSVNWVCPVTSYNRSKQLSNFTPSP